MAKRFADFGEFFELLQRYNRETVEFGMLRFNNGESYAVTVPAVVEPRVSLVQVTGVAEDSPAHQAGIQTGDLIIRLNGREFPLSGDSADTVKEISRKYEGRALTLTVVRFENEGQRRIIEAHLVPRADPPDGRDV